MQLPDFSDKLFSTWKFIVSTMHYTMHYTVFLAIHQIHAKLFLANRLVCMNHIDQGRGNAENSR